MKNIYSKIVAATIEQIGSKAVTLKGQAKAITKYGKLVQPGRPYPLHLHDLDRLPIGTEIILDKTKQNVPRYRFRAVENPVARKAAAESIGKCGQKSNYSTGCPKIWGQPYQKRWETISYKGSFKGYKGSYLYQDYQSCVGISRSGRSAIVISECILRHRIIAPVGTVFAIDNNGILLKRVSDGMDYHPEYHDWVARDFCTRMRRGMSKNYAKRQEQKRAEKIAAKDAKEAARIKAIYDRETQSTRVTLDDSRRAGNCVEGSLRYAERRLAIPREVLVNGLWLYSVPAALLRRNTEPGVERAIRAAWMRETTICI